MEERSKVHDVEYNEHVDIYIPENCQKYNGMVSINYFLCMNVLLLFNNCTRLIS